MDGPLEFFTGRRPAGGNRRWRDAKKAAIVAETLEPGARVAAVAARHGLKPNHVSSWRTMARRGELILPAPETAAEFAALVVSPERDVVRDGAAGMPTSNEPGVPGCVTAVVRPRP
jgi:transposase